MWEGQQVTFGLSYRVCPRNKRFEESRFHSDCMRHILLEKKGGGAKVDPSLFWTASWDILFGSGVKNFWQKGFYQQDLLQSVNTYGAGVFKGNTAIKPSLENVVQNNLMCTDVI